ncbi:MAG: GNAT family N-acetyltransferase [Ktedonobacterales bacterium]|nr:GNAT family N-acetyltransferase [Ktedonobacterales bacterium]
MIPAPRIETATAGDVALLAALRAEQRWHPNEALLRAVLSWEGGRVFVIREPTAEDTTPAGIMAAACALAAGAVGVIGSVIVRPRYQRRGLGRQVMRAALDWQRQRGVRSVLLDATVEGRPLYAQLGFVSLDAYSWEAEGVVATLDRVALVQRARGLRATLRPPDELARVTALDAAAFGGDRLALLARVLALPDQWLYIADDPDGMARGYLIVCREEPPHAGIRIGPWVASRPEAAAALLAAALDDKAPWRRHLPTSGEPRLAAVVPGYCPSAFTILRAAGAHLTRDDLLLRLDFATSVLPSEVTPATPHRPFAAQPEWAYAWLAPMVF